MPRLLRLKPAAEYLGRSPKSLRAMIQRGELPVVKTDNHAPFHIDLRDLNEWIENHKVTL
ncbi:MAG: helix-turn-helix domain-containing protein [Acidobacteriia bacterium]|nr:helix-turn-helix domain-containing protein [Terriglobia bacterium]